MQVDFKVLKVNTGRQKEMKNLNQQFLTWGTRTHWGTQAVCLGYAEI